MRHARRTGSSLLLALGCTLMAACGGGRVSEHVALDGSLEPLRAAFEADGGKVRAIFLASPT